MGCHSRTGCLQLAPARCPEHPDHIERRLVIAQLDLHHSSHGEHLRSLPWYDDPTHLSHWFRTRVCSKWTMKKNERSRIWSGFHDFVLRLRWLMGYPCVKFKINSLKQYLTHFYMIRCTIISNADHDNYSYSQSNAINKPFISNNSKPIFYGFWFGAERNGELPALVMNDLNWLFEL